MTFVDPGYRGVPAHFRRAWDAVPDLVQRYTNSQDSGEPRYVWIRQETEAAIQRSRNASGYDRRLAEAVDYLDDKDTDLLYEVQAAYGEPAFALGLALGVYLATNGGQR